jgi:hypothetical protein
MTHGPVNASLAAPIAALVNDNAITLLDIILHMNFKPNYANNLISTRTSPTFGGTSHSPPLPTFATTMRTEANARSTAPTGTPRAALESLLLTYSVGRALALDLLSMAFGVGRTLRLGVPSILHVVARSMPLETLLLPSNDTLLTRRCVELELAATPPVLTERCIKRTISSEPPLRMCQNPRR